MGLLLDDGKQLGSSLSHRHRIGQSPAPSIPGAGGKIGGEAARRCSVLRIACVLLADILISGEAHATTCMPLSPEDHLTHASVVFWGVPRNLPLASGNGAANAKVVFDVLRNVKGLAGTKSTVLSYVNDGGTTLGWKFTPKKPQLIFARRAPSGSLTVEFCDMALYHFRRDLHQAYGGLVGPPPAK